MKNVGRNLNLILIRKFKYLLHLKYALVCSLYARLFIACTYGFLLENEEFRGIIWYVPWNASIPYDKYRWINEVYNVLRIVSGMKRFSLFRRTICLATFINIAVIWFTNFIFLSRCMSKNFVTEVSLILLSSILIILKFLFFIVFYLDNFDILIFIIREQHMLRFICICAILFDVRYLLRHFISLLISMYTVDSITLSPGI